MISAIQSYQNTPNLNTNKTNNNKLINFGSSCNAVPIEEKAIKIVKELANSQETRTLGFLSGFKKSFDDVNTLIAKDGEDIKCTFEFSDIQVQNNMKPDIAVCGKFRIGGESLSIESEPTQLSYIPVEGKNHQQEYAPLYFLEKTILLQIQRFKDFKAGNDFLAKK